MPAGHLSLDVRPLMRETQHMVHRMTFVAIGLTVLLLSTALAVHAGEDKKPAGAFEGLVFEEAMSQLPQTAEKRVGDEKVGRTFLYGIITEAKQFQNFSQAAGHKFLDVNWD